MPEDYGYAPGLEEPGQITHPGHLRRLFERRPNTKLVPEGAAPSVSDLIKYLKEDSLGFVVRPIDNILIGAHSTAEGTITIKMFAEQEPAKNGRTYSNFETLEETLADDEKTIKILPPLIGPGQHFVHFKGCNIGEAVPFLTKWKEAFGNVVKLTAPRFGHGVADNANYGTWEFMMYEFKVHSQKGFDNRTQLIQAFQDKKFRFRQKLVDGELKPGDLVPAGHWDTWIPKIREKPNVIAGTSPRPFSFNVEPPLGQHQTLIVNQVFTRDTTKYIHILKYDNKGLIPKTLAERMVDFRKDLQDDPKKRFKFPAEHPFPVYRRFGYDNFEQFIAGYDWKFKPKTFKKKTEAILQVTGIRVRYTLDIAVTDPDPPPVPNLNNLVFNFVPNRDGEFKDQAHTELKESDPIYFRTIPSEKAPDG